MKTINVLLIIIMGLTFFIMGCDDSDSSTNPELTIAEKAQQVVMSFETGDTTPWLDYVSEETYIQHNLGFPDGRDVVIGAMEAGQLDGTTVDIRRTFVDGNFVIMHTDYFFFGMDQVGIDVFRFEDGKIVEHWDNLQVADGDAISPVNGNTMLNGSTTIEDLDRTEENRVLVENFVTNILVGTQWSSYPTYISPNYSQHNPDFPDGPAIFEMFPDGTPFFSELKYIHAQGNFVITMSEGYADADTGLANAFFDIFRLENGLIIEHWDAVQTIPAEAEWVNSNGKW